MWTTHRHLLPRFPRAHQSTLVGRGHRGGGSSQHRESTHPGGRPSHCLVRRGRHRGREATNNGGSSPWASLTNGALHYGGSGFYLKHPVCRALPLIPVPWGYLLRANRSPLPGSALQTPHFSTLSPCLQWWTPSQAGWAGQGSVPRVQVSLCPPATRWLPCSLPRMWSSPLSFCFPQGCRSHLASFPPPFPSSFFWTTSLSRNPSCPFRCLTSSANFLQRLCENCYICRCILDAFVERDQLHVCLILCHLGPSVSI